MDKIICILANPIQFKIPLWFLNRQKDVVDGRFYQVSYKQCNYWLVSMYQTFRIKINKKKLINNILVESFIYSWLAKSFFNFFCEYLLHNQFLERTGKLIYKWCRDSHLLLKSLFIHYRISENIEKEKNFFCIFTEHLSWDTVKVIFLFISRY